MAAKAALKLAAIATSGLEVKKSLHRAGDSAVQARGQITSTTVLVARGVDMLHHLGAILEAGDVYHHNVNNKSDNDDDDNNDDDDGGHCRCTSQLLTDVVLVAEMFHGTLRGIELVLDRLGQLASVHWHWHFTETRADELRQLLIAQVSVMQIMLNVLTTAHLSILNAEHADDIKAKRSELRLGLRETTALVVINYLNIQRLHEAEKKIPQEDKGRYNASAVSRPDVLVTEIHSDDSGDGFGEARSASVRSPSLNLFTDEFSEQLNEDASVHDVTSLSELSALVPSLLEPRHKDESTASQKLMRLVPYIPMNLVGTKRQVPVSDGNETYYHEPTSLVRCLLDKWTKAGSKSLSETFADLRNVEGDRPRTSHLAPTRMRPLQTSSRRGPQEYRLRRGILAQRHGDPSSYSSSVDDTTGNDVATADVELSPLLQPSPVPGDNVRHFWQADPQQSKDASSAAAYLEAMRKTGGGVIYSKSDMFHQRFYVDGREFFRHDFVPPSKVGHRYGRKMTTALSSVWVHRAALDLHGYAYEEKDPGVYTIPEDLDFAEIEHLVSLSYQALDRQFTLHAKRVKKELMKDKKDKGKARSSGKLPSDQKQERNGPLGEKSNRLDNIADGNDDDIDDDIEDDTKTRGVQSLEGAIVHEAKVSKEYQGPGVKDPSQTASYYERWETKENQKEPQSNRQLLSGLATRIEARKQPTGANVEGWLMRQ